MGNGNQPAYGTAKVRFVSAEGTNYYDETKLGLTKRELIAAMALQGILADGNSFTSQESVVVQAINCADALLKSLSE